MAEEVELKLALPENAWRAVARHPRLAAAEKLPPRKLVNIYYDTPELDLRRKGVALRLRQQGRQWLQTVKCAGTLAGGLSTRPEWEYPYDGQAFDFAPIDDAKLRRWLRRDRLAKRLQPAFETTFSRQTWRIATGEHSTILVMFDRGRIQAAGRSLPISELELELAGAAVGDLFELARELAALLPLRPEPLSKAERGYRLIGAPPSSPRPSTGAPLDAGRSALEAFRVIGLSCLARLQDNEPGVRDGGDPESMRQARIEVCRLRSLLRLFRPLLPASLLGDVPTRLRALGATLGEARDWKVLVSKLLRPVADASPGDAQLERLIEAAAAHREEARAAVVAAVDDAAYGRLMIDLVALLHSPELDTTAPATPTFADFAAEQLNRLRRRAGKAARGADGLDTEALDGLRIAVSRLHDALELCAPIYRRKAVQRDLRRLARAQDRLDMIHDLVDAGARLALCADDDSGLWEAVARVGAWHKPRYRKWMAKLPGDVAAMTERRFAWERWT